MGVTAGVATQAVGALLLLALLLALFGLLPVLERPGGEGRGWLHARQPAQGGEASLDGKHGVGLGEIARRCGRRRRRARDAEIVR